jgi:hypothetical protein
MLTGLTATAPDEIANPAGDLLDGVAAPINNGIGFGAGVLRDAFDGIPRGLAKQADPEAVGQAVEDEGTTLTARIEDRVNQAVQSAKGQDFVGNGVVRAQGEVRGAVTTAVSDVTNTLRGGKPSKATEDTTAPTSVAKSFGDTAKKAVSDVRQAAKDTRDAAKNRPTADDDE